MAEIDFPSYNLQFRGMRIPIGGGGGDVIFDRITQEIHPGTDLAIVTVNSEHEDEMYVYNEEKFKDAGFRGEIKQIHSGMEAEEAQIQLLDNIGGIYISGGDQKLGLERMQRLQIDRLIVALNKAGAVVAGTSAGCSELGEISPFDNTSIPGLNIINGVILDQHLKRPNRLKRLLRLSENEKRVGLGLEAGAALAIDPEGKAEFIGEGNVHILTPTNGRSYKPLILGADNLKFALQEWIEQTVYEAYAVSSPQAA